MVGAEFLLASLHHLHLQLFSSVPPALILKRRRRNDLLLQYLPIRLTAPPRPQPELMVRSLFTPASFLNKHKWRILSALPRVSMSYAYCTMDLLAQINGWHGIPFFYYVKNMI
jgi:hypothetical protein